jgi:hypothetical protein
MITGGKIGSIIGRRRAFSIGCVVYGCRLAHHRAGPEPHGAHHRLVVPRGLGAALIMPAVVALVAGNFAPSGRPGLRAHRRRRRDRRRRPGR